METEAAMKQVNILTEEVRECKESISHRDLTIVDLEQQLSLAKAQLAQIIQDRTYPTTRIFN